MGAAQAAVSRPNIQLSERGKPMLAVQVQRPGRLASAGRAESRVLDVTPAGQKGLVASLLAPSRRGEIAPLDSRSPAGQSITA